MTRLSKAQRDALDFLRCEPDRGFDLPELAGLLRTSPEGAARTCSSLLRRGLVVRFVGGVSPQRVHYQAAE